MNQQGGSRFSLYIFFVLLFVVVHVALKIVPMYMDSMAMEDEMSVKAGVAQVLKDEEILRDLVTKAKELDLPLTAESFVLDRNVETRRMKISTKEGWDIEHVFLWGVYTHTFHFDPVVDESFMSVR